MVRPVILEPPRQPPLVLSIPVHDPDDRRFARRGAAKYDVTSVGGLTGAEVPDRWVAVGKGGHGIVPGIEPTNLRSAPGQIRFEIAIEMVGVGALRLELPGNFGPRQLAREKNGPVVGPHGHVGTASSMLGIAISRPEPMNLAAR